MTIVRKIYSKIIGTGSYLPEKRVTNQDLTEQLAAKGIETSDEWIVSRSGISARHYAAPMQNSSDLGVEAAKKALEMAGLDGNDLDLIIVASSTPDFFGSFPSTACIVQNKLGITNQLRGGRRAGRLQRLRVCGRHRRQLHPVGHA